MILGRVLARLSSNLTGRRPMSLGRSRHARWGRRRHRWNRLHEYLEAEVLSRDCITREELMIRRQRSELEVDYIRCCLDRVCAVYDAAHYAQLLPFKRLIALLTL